MSSEGRGWLPIALTVVLALASCSTSGEPLTTVGSSTTNSTSTPTTTGAPPSSTTTTAAPVNGATTSFDIPLGNDGLTYDTAGAPPSGPSSFAALSDGSIVVADTLAVARDEPRLLHFDSSGKLLAVIDLADEDVAAVVDVVTDGSRLAILDVLVATSRYRVLTLSVDGNAEASVEIPSGFRFEDGLTGLAWDDEGILLEFEFGARYARLTEEGTIEAPATPIFDGVTVELTPGSGRLTEVVSGSASFAIERSTDLGGVTLIGVGPDGSIVVIVDEVDVSGPAIVVKRRVQRYSADGQLETEQVFDAADQFVEIPRPFELDATGQVLYLQAWPDRVTIAVIG